MALISLVLAGGCSNAAPGGGQVQRPTPSPSTVGTPPPGTGAEAWSAEVGWSANYSLGLPPYPDEPVTNAQIFAAQVKYGLVATIGDVVVMPSLPSGGSTSAPMSLRFLDSKTGAIVADRKLPACFEGLRAETVAGEPVVEVRYCTQGTPAEVNALFDASGRQIWSSAGESLGEPSPTVGDMADGGLFSRGYRLQYVPDPGTGSGTWNRGGAYHVLDVADHTVLTVPVDVSVSKTDPAAGITNSISLAGGFAVVSTPEQALDPQTAVTTRITVDDLAAGGRRVATFTERTIKPANGDAPARVVAAIGDRLLLTWMGPTSPTQGFHEGPYQDLFFSVLNISSGTATPPVDTGLAPTGIAIPPTAFTDPSTSTVVEYGMLPNPGAVGLSPRVMFAVNLLRGTVSWTRRGAEVVEPVSAHGGILFGMQGAADGGQTPIALALADGRRTAGNFTVAPLAFTADGAPVFVQAVLAPVIPTPSRSSAAPGSVAVRRPRPAPATDAFQVWVAKPQ